MLKNISFAVLALVCQVVCFAKPAVKSVIKAVNPDGSDVSILKRGDERCHNTFSLDGLPITFNEELGFVYLLPDKEGILRESGVCVSDPQKRDAAESTFVKNIDRVAVDNALKQKATKAAERNRYSMEGRIRSFGSEPETRGPGRFHYTFPVKGKQKGLVILVEFQDVKFNSKNTAQYAKVDAYTYFSELLNKPGFDTYGATGSARDWFIDNSKGQFEPDFDVYGPVLLPNKMSYYGKNDSSGDDKAPHEMVIHACQDLEGKVDFSQYDRDGDGYVDNVYVFYAGYGEADSYESNSVWPHSWTISDATAPNWFTPGQPLKIEDVYIDSYACSNETNGYGASKGRPDGIGTFVHEFSHVMGLPDLYCTVETSNSNTPFTPGAFSVLDYGPYNNDGLTPPNYSAYERYALDWIEPESVQSGINILENLADSNRALKVNTEAEREFFLFENRQQTGWDKYIPYHGMLVWHVDYLKSVFEANTVNNSKTHQYVDLVEADNIQDYPNSFGGVKSTETGDPFPGTANVTSFGAETTPALLSWGKKTLDTEISDIKEQNGIIFFQAALDGENHSSNIDEVSYKDATQEAVYFDLLGREIKNPASGFYIRKQGNKSSIIRITQ